MVAARARLRWRMASSSTWETEAGGRAPAEDRTFGWTAEGWCSGAGLLGWYARTGRGDEPSP
jgi:hypothetical protein